MGAAAVVVRLSLEAHAAAAGPGLPRVAPFGEQLDRVADRRRRAPAIAVVHRDVHTRDLGAHVDVHGGRGGRRRGRGGCGGRRRGGCGRRGRGGRRGRRRGRGGGGFGRCRCGFADVAYRGGDVGFGVVGGGFVDGLAGRHGGCGFGVAVRALVGVGLCRRGRRGVGVVGWGGVGFGGGGFDVGPAAEVALAVAELVGIDGGVPDGDGPVTDGDVVAIEGVAVEDGQAPAVGGVARRLLCVWRGPRWRHRRFGDRRGWGRRLSGGGRRGYRRWCRSWRRRGQCGRGVAAAGAGKEGEACEGGGERAHSGARRPPARRRWCLRRSMRYRRRRARVAAGCGGEEGECGAATGDGAHDDLPGALSEALRPAAPLSCSLPGEVLRVRCQMAWLCVAAAVRDFTTRPAAAGRVGVSCLVVRQIAPTSRPRGQRTEGHGTGRRRLRQPRPARCGVVIGAPVRLGPTCREGVLVPASGCDQ